MTSILTIDGVTKRYASFMLEKVSLTLPPGAIMGLIGPNGAGKSTLFKAILNLVRIDTGSITVFGLDHRRHEQAIKRRVGFVSEEIPFYDSLTVAELSRFVSSYYPTWDDALFAALQKRFALSAHKKVGDLSKGNRMKLSLCLALAHRPELLLLDEPTAGLDAVARRELLEEMLDVIQEEDRSVLFSSHITADVERVADYVTLIHQGRVCYTGLRDDLQGSWRRILISGDFPPEARPHLVHVEPRFGGYAGVTGDMDALRRSWPGGIPAGVALEAISLEEILIALAKQSSEQGA
ncbi:ATP-binding cassette domain-containing protein [Heliobacterium undosum]|uniref:ATP-binding cassette domain-containing protein n=1 Tax=Heliomicrobium undosum TaxID=121734 RepID=A0A845L5S5_9FIRM|nr:ABC transporter ATP-binding protein [Heliomicrobium undosum]MZP31056.1 ATP-binding cassette domain-containing protein [Heliomicrobium undosum]